MKIDRLVSTIMIILNKERIGAQELADMFEVLHRIIYRDIDTINMADIPVCSTSGVGGGFEIMRKYKIDKKVSPIAGWPVHTTAENSREIIRDVLSADGTYAVTIKGDDRAIGSIGMMVGGKSNLALPEILLICDR